VAELLAGADLFVLSTRSEVFSVSTLEAMAAGLPVVVSDIPAFDEMFTDGVEGRKVPPADPQALAAVLAELLTDSPARRRMGQAAQARARQFTVDRMAEEFEGLLRCLHVAGRAVR